MSLCFIKGRYVLNVTPIVKFNFVMYKFLKEQLLYVETYPVAIFLKCSIVQNAEEKFLNFYSQTCSNTRSPQFM
jgi:hypothetical protein